MNWGRSLRERILQQPRQLLIPGLQTHWDGCSKVSNLGFGVALKQMQINHEVAQVGDRYVMQQMIASGAVLGGEDSGHIIFLDHHTTGARVVAQTFR